jgi:hypothetical protein
VQARPRPRSRSACGAAASNTCGCSLQHTGLQPPRHGLQLGLQPATKEPWPTASSTVSSSVQLVRSSTLRRCGWAAPRPVSKIATRMPAPVCPSRQSACSMHRSRVRAWLCTGCACVHAPSSRALFMLRMRGGGVRTSAWSLAVIWGAASRRPWLPVCPGKSRRRAGPWPGSRLALLPPSPSLPKLLLQPLPPPPLLHLAANEKSALGRPRPRRPLRPTPYAAAASAPLSRHESGEWAGSLSEAASACLGDGSCSAWLCRPLLGIGSDGPYRRSGDISRTELCRRSARSARLRCARVSCKRTSAKSLGSR